MKKSRSARSSRSPRPRRRLSKPGRANQPVEKTVNAATPEVVTRVDRPTITCVEFSDGIQVNVNSQRYQTFAVPDGLAVQQLLRRIEEQTGAIVVVRVDLTHLDS